MVNSAKIELFLRLWYKYCVFPIALALLLFCCYGFVAYPEVFMVQEVNCYGNYIDCEPATAKLSFFGATIKDIDVPVVSHEEFVSRQAFFNRVEFFIMLAYVLIGFGLVSKYWDKIKKVIVSGS